MNRGLGVRTCVYGLAAGAFFWRYCLALTNSLGKSAGYLGSIAGSCVRQSTRSFQAGLFVFAAAGLVSTLAALTMLPTNVAERPLAGILRQLPIRP